MPDRSPTLPGVMPDLAELSRIHDMGIELIECSDDLDELLDRVLDEYETRLADMRHDTIEGHPEDRDEAQKLRALVMFATQAAALKQKAVANEDLKRRAEELERHESLLKKLSQLTHKINNPLTMCGYRRFMRDHNNSLAFLVQLID